MAFKDKEKELSYIAKYQKENYDRITIMASKGKKTEYKAAAELLGLSLSAFVMQCVDEKIHCMKNS